MRIDLYTKVVLTIIAACLICIAFRPVLAPQPAIAQQVAPVYIQNNPWEAIPVRIIGIEHYSKNHKITDHSGNSKWKYHDEPWNPLPVEQKK